MVSEDEGSEGAGAEGSGGKEERPQLAAVSEADMPEAAELLEGAEGRKDKTLGRGAVVGGVARVIKSTGGVRRREIGGELT